jgi:hypothetical protein
LRIESTDCAELEHRTLLWKRIKLVSSLIVSFSTVPPCYILLAAPVLTLFIILVMMLSRHRIWIFLVPPPKSCQIEQSVGRHQMIQTPRICRIRMIHHNLFRKYEYDQMPSRRATTFHWVNFGASQPSPTYIFTTTLAGFCQWINYYPDSSGRNRASISSLRVIPAL